jgi:hypothetical protein
LCVVVASVVHDEEIDMWSEVSILVWPIRRSSGSRSGDGSQASASLHETGGSICYLAHDDVPMATDGDGISICSTEEMEKYESLCQ